LRIRSVARCTGAFRGTQAIRGFYSAAEGVGRLCELVSLRVSGNEAAFQFRLTVTAGDNKIQIEPIETMAFDDGGKATAMKAYWSAADVTPALAT
jgi:steroid Delta-isomerase